MVFKTTSSRNISIMKNKKIYIGRKFLWSAAHSYCGASIGTFYSFSPRQGWGRYVNPQSIITVVANLVRFHTFTIQEMFDSCVKILIFQNLRSHFPIRVFVRSYAFEESQVDQKSTAVKFSGENTLKICRV